MKIEKIGSFLILCLVAFLPWSVVMAIFGSVQMNLDIFKFTKEIIIVCIVILYLIDVFKRKIKIKCDIFDSATIAFIVLLIGISIVQEISLKGIVYGLRYDVGFLLVVMIMKRALLLWKVSLYDVLKVFLISGGAMLFLSILIRYIFGETVLTVLGFSGQISVWNAKGVPPIYHGIPGASVIRFQGMLEGPNQMAFFLLLYMGSYMTIFSKMKKYTFMNVIVMGLLLFLLLQTYSRSGYLGAILGITYVSVYSLVNAFRTGNILKKYKVTFKKILVFLTVIFCVMGVLVLQFSNKIVPIFERHGSTSGHMERMYIGWLRFQEDPFGQGLSQAGPASRAVFDVTQEPIADSAITDPVISHVVAKLHKRNADFVFNTETYYIPESWYIQLMIEGGVVGILFFGCIMMMILFQLRIQKYLFGATCGMFLMNLVLHSFESVHTTYMWSIIVACIFILSQNGVQKISLQKKSLN